MDTTKPVKCLEIFEIFDIFTLLNRYIDQLREAFVCLEGLVQSGDIAHGYEKRREEQYPVCCVVLCAVC